MRRLAALWKPGPMHDTRRWARQYRSPVVLMMVALVGIALSLGLFAYARGAHRRVVKLSFARRAADRVVIIRGVLDQTFEKIHTLGDEMRRDPAMSDARFRATVTPWLKRQPFIHAMGYVKRVPAAGREAFDREAKRRGYTMFDRGPEGGRAPAAPRRVHFPLVHIDRRGEGAQAIRGFDVAGSARRMRTIDRARDTGRMAASAPVRLVSNNRPGILGCEPIYAGGATPPTVARRREKLVGLVVAAVQLGELIHTALTPARAVGIHLWLFDITDQTPTLLNPDPPAGARSRADPGRGPGDPGGEPGADRAASYASLRGRPMAYHTTMADMGGRSWEAICTPTEAYLAAHSSLAPWGVLGAGLLGTALVLALLTAQGVHARRLDRVSQERARINRALAQRYTEKRAAEAALSSSNQRLRAVNAEMEQFVSAVSHDLKSPLITTAMLVDMLEKELSQGRPQRVMEAAGHIAKSTRRMHRIVDNLIEHNRAGWSTLQPREVDLRDLALDAAENHREDADRRGVRIEVQTSMPEIVADRGWLLTALGNLVSNALKYGCAPDEPCICIGASEQDETVRLWVHDNGPGIDAEQREKVFELFARASRDPEGTGIGLAIVQRVAHSHGGRAWVDSAPDAGCTFYLELARRPPESE